MCHCNKHTVVSHPLLLVSSQHTPYLHLLYTILTPLVHHTYTSCTPYYTSCTPYLHLLYTILHLLYTILTPLVHHTYTSCTPYLHLLYTILTPLVHHTYTSCTPYLHLYICKVVSLSGLQLRCCSEEYRSCLAGKDTVHYRKTAHHRVLGSSVLTI